MLSKLEILSALEAAKAAPFEPIRTCGCGRAYVCVTGERAEINAVSAACKKLGLLFVRKNYGAGNNAIYAGYDNADGRAMGKAEAMAKVLNERGLRCYVDGASD